MRLRNSIHAIAFGVVSFCFFNLILVDALDAQIRRKKAPNPIPTFFKDVILFDGEKVVGRTNVHIEDGKITAIGPEVEQRFGDEVVDGSGRTLMPGMIDCHTHVWFESHLNQAALFGVTTELDMMSSPAAMKMFRSRQKRSKANDRADVYSAGAAVTVKGGHGTQFGLPVPTVATTEDVPGFVRARVKEGSDYIKIIYEDGSSYGFTQPTISEEMFVAAVATAHETDKLAVSHISTADGATLALRSGVDGLVHLFANSKIEAALVETAKSKGLFVVPTAAVVSNTCGANTTENIIRDKQLRKLMTNENLSNLTKGFPVSEGNMNSWVNLSHNIAALHKAGVPILAGTDSPNPGTVHGASMHHELRLLVKAGLSPVEALAAATSKPADCFRLNDRGRIANGLRSDLLLVAGDPTKDIDDVSNIVGVWKQGHKIDPGKRLAVVQEEIDRSKIKREPAKEDRLISGFNSDEGDSPKVSVGAGWQVSTDSMMGGNSTCGLSWANEGAAGSKGSLLVSGKCRKTQPRFAGAMFYPGKTPMASANINPHRGISFRAKGSGETFRVMVFFQKRGFQPSTKSFIAGDDWKEYQFKFSEFDGCDGSGITGIWFGSDSSGKFEFKIDEVTLTK
jgi:imidazolonepropionase-like amidohydrolase